MNPFLLSAFSNLPSIETRKALLLLDFQNDFVRPNGRLPVRKTLDFLDLIPGLVQSFRRTGEVVWVRTQYEVPRPTVDDYGSELIITSAGSLDTKNQKKSRHGRRNSHISVDGTGEVDPEAFLSGPDPICLPHTSGFQFPAPILTAIDYENDIVIEKSDYSALQSPGLVLSLRSRFVTELYICGSLSNVSVYATALDAAQQGFTITLIEDCMGYRSFARHEEAIRRLADIVGANGLSVQELLEDEDWEETQEIARIPESAAESSVHESSIALPPGIEGVLDHLAVRNSPPAKRSSIIAEQSDYREDSRASESLRTPSPNASIYINGAIEADDNPYDDNDDEMLVLPRKKYPRASTSQGVRETRIQGSKSVRQRRNKLGKSPTSSSRPGSAANQSGSRSTPSPVLTTASTKSLKSISPILASNSLPSPAPTVSCSAKRKEGCPKHYLGPDNTIAEGDSRIVYDLDLPADAFGKIKEEANWQKMYHMSGQVPRLVAVQGVIFQDNSFPIYRHPADESPTLEPFTQTVNAVRICAEKIVGHPLNHVLIQLYRDGQDNIAEHSDKTLDIARGSSIVNVSLGAQRTMILRTKKSASVDSNDAEGHKRQKQEVPMPHGSMFILGQTSNMRWLHGIRPDKRPESEKSLEEKAYQGERISLTFRNINTFINPDLQTIWGQGAVSKYPEFAQEIIHGNAAETEKLIRAFGMENHETDFNWDAVYGCGFDVVNFIEPAVARVGLSGDPIADMRVRLCLTENGMRYEATHQNRSSDIHQITYTSPDGKIVVAGDIQILLYLASLNASSNLARPGVDFLRGGSHLFEISRLGTAWQAYSLSGSRAEFEPLLCFNNKLREAEVKYDQHYIAGTTLTIDDLALWPVLYQIEKQQKLISSSAAYSYLWAYYQRIEKRGCVRVVMDEISSG